MSKSYRAGRRYLRRLGYKFPRRNRAVTSRMYRLRRGRGGKR